MKDIGIYVHIPFCKSKCFYCDFTSFANCEEIINEYIQCLKLELIKKADLKYNVNTIYIGGGTPSYINAKYIEEIINTVKTHYNVIDNAEITIEVNPGSADKRKLERYYQAGINRLSVGLQTSNNKILKLIGRIHTYEQYVKTVQLAKKTGFTNINSDIIIGLPEQTIYDVEDTINKLLELDLTHISIYSLIIEENTKIEKMINDGMVKLPDEEIERYMYWFAKRKLEKNGYIHYEISNFSKPGYMSKHNMDCWKQKEYLGFGVSASSYENKKRYSNTNSIKKYIKNINMNKLENNINVEEKQTISDQRNEYMILGLRKLSGINIDEFVKKFSRSPLVIYRKQIENLLAKDLITIDINSIKLSKKGLDFANIVWEEFI